MNLNERYRIHNQSKSNKSLFIYLAIFTILVFSNSFSRYFVDSNKTLALEVANWSINVNNIKITETTKTISNGINFVVTDHPSNDGTIKPGQKGYFDITVDPENTEVSIKYTITIDTSELPEGIKLKDYSINGSNEKITMQNNKKIEETLFIYEKLAFDSSDIKTYRIFWEWEDDDAKSENIRNNYKIKANIQIEQIIND